MKKKEINKFFLCYFYIIFCFSLNNIISISDKEFDCFYLEDLYKELVKNNFDYNKNNFINKFIDPLINTINIKEQIKTLFNFLNIEDKFFISLKQSSTNNNYIDPNENNFFQIINNDLFKNNILNILSKKLNEFEMNLAEVIGEGNISIIKGFIENKEERPLGIDIDNKNYIKTDLLFYIEYRLIFENLKNKYFESNFVNIDSSNLEFKSNDISKKIFLGKNINNSDNCIKISTKVLKKDNYILYLVKKYLKNENQLKEYVDYLKKNIEHYNKFSISMIREENYEYIIKEIILDDKFFIDNNKESSEKFRNKIDNINKSILIDDPSNKSLDNIEACIKKFSNYSKLNLEDFDTLDKYFNNCKINDRRERLNFLNKYFEEKKNKDPEVEKLFKSYYLQEAEKELKNIYGVMGNENSLGFEGFIKYIKNENSPCLLTIKNHRRLREDSNFFFKTISNYIKIFHNLEDPIYSSDEDFDSKLENLKIKNKPLLIIYEDELPIVSVTNDPDTKLKKSIISYNDVLKKNFIIITSDHAKRELTKNAEYKHSIDQFNNGKNLFEINLCKRLKESVDFMVKDSNLRINEEEKKILIQNYVKNENSIKERVQILKNFSSKKEKSIERFEKNKKSKTTATKTLNDFKRLKDFKEFCNNELDFYMNEDEFIHLHDTFLSLFKVKSNNSTNRYSGRLIVGAPGTGKTKIIELFKKISTIMDGLRVVALASDDLNKSFHGESEKLITSIMNESEDYRNDEQAVATIIDECDRIFTETKKDNSNDNNKMGIKNAILERTGNSKDIGLFIGITSSDKFHNIDKAIMSRLKRFDIYSLKDVNQIKKMIENKIGKEFSENQTLINYFTGNNTSHSIYILEQLRDYISQHGINKSMFNLDLNNSDFLNKKLIDFIYGEKKSGPFPNDNDKKIAAAQYLFAEKIGLKTFGISKQFRKDDIFLGTQTLTEEMIENKTTEEKILLAAFYYLPININSDRVSGKQTKNSLYKENFDFILNNLFNSQSITKQRQINKDNFDPKFDKNKMLLNYKSGNWWGWNNIKKICKNYGGDLFGLTIDIFKTFSFDIFPHLGMSLLDYIQGDTKEKKKNKFKFIFRYCFY